MRERWKAHVASSRIKPVLLVDEAQEMAPDVLSELRILSSADFDATSLLTVVLSGDATTAWNCCVIKTSFRWEHEDPHTTGDTESASRVRNCSELLEPRARQGRQRNTDDQGTHGCLG